MRPLTLLLLFLSFLCTINSDAQSITPTISDSASVGDTLVWKYVLPGSKDSFSNFKLDRLKGFVYIDLLHEQELKQSQLRKSDGKEELLRSETEISVLVRASKTGSFHTGSASATWINNGTTIRAAPQWIKVSPAKQKKTKP